MQQHDLNLSDGNHVKHYHGGKVMLAGVGRRAVVANPMEAAYVKLPSAMKVVNASQQSGGWQDYVIRGDGGAMSK